MTVSGRRLAWSLWATAVVLTAAGLFFLALNGSTETPNSIGSPVIDGVFAAFFLSFATVGALIAARQPRNPIGWLFLGGGLAAALEEPLLGWSTYALVAEPGSLPGGAAAVASLAPVRLDLHARHGRVRRGHSPEPRWPLLLPLDRQPARDRGRGREPPDGARLRQPDRVRLAARRAGRAGAPLPRFERRRARAAQVDRLSGGRLRGAHPGSDRAGRA